MENSPSLLRGGWRRPAILLLPMAALSLLRAIKVPTDPEPGNEVLPGRRPGGPAPGLASAAA